MCVGGGSIQWSREEDKEGETKMVGEDLWVEAEECRERERDKERDRERQTERQTERERGKDRQTDRDRDRQTNRDRDRTKGSAAKHFRGINR